MSHDYTVLLLHYARAADLQAEARQDSVARRVLRARRALARLTAPGAVRPLPRRDHGSPAGVTGDDREAA